MTTNFDAKQQLGSATAKGGFANEHDIVAKFNHYKIDDNAQTWLSIMGYDLSRIQGLEAKQIPTRINKKKAHEFGVSAEKVAETQKFKKADIQVQLTITIDDIVYRENISLKKANQSANFNQIDKRSVDTYQTMWQFNDEIANTLKKFTGATIPSNEEAQTLRDKRRWYLDELPEQEVEQTLDFFRDNRHLIFSDILRGRGLLSAEWFLVTCKNDDDTVRWSLKNINEVINFYAQGDITLSKKGGLILGRLTAQRKGGTPDPTSLQFKIKPNDIFMINEQTP